MLKHLSEYYKKKKEEASDLTTERITAISARVSFNVTRDDYLSHYSFVITSGVGSLLCSDIGFSESRYEETFDLFPKNKKKNLASTSVNNPVPPYLFIEAELTEDLKNISVFYVRAASSLWQCTWSNYALPFASVLQGEACTLTGQVEALVEKGLPISKNLTVEYVLLRISLSAILGVPPFCCFSADLLRQRYWLPFLNALKASEFKAAAVFFEEPRYNLVGYERFFEY